MTIDGHDVRSVTLESLRRQMGVMLQDTFIFSGNVRENIRYGKLDATDEEIVAAAKAVHAHEFIMELPDGYDTVVEERGSTLSAGQRQLIAFARVLLADPRILILDEATSNIDTRTEEALQAGLNHLLKGRTSFIIAHRLSTIENADEICFIDHGQIVEQGNHAELLARHGAYYRLYESQYAMINGLSSRRQPSGGRLPYFLARISAIRNACPTVVQPMRGHLGPAAAVGFPSDMPPCGMCFGATRGIMDCER